MILLVLRTEKFNFLLDQGDSLFYDSPFDYPLSFGLLPSISFRSKAICLIGRWSFSGSGNCLPDSLEFHPSLLITFCIPGRGNVFPLGRILLGAQLCFTSWALFLLPNSQCNNWVYQFPSFLLIFKVILVLCLV